MPRISTFYGIIITMRWLEHGPPHFHARYGAAKASIAIKPLGVLHSSLPPRQLGMVVEWAAIHQDELVANWKKAQEHDALAVIAPLP
jgi:hypothetical protein